MTCSHDTNSLWPAELCAGALTRQASTIPLILKHLQVLLSTAPAEPMVAFIASIVLTATSSDASESATHTSRTALQQLLVTQHPHLRSAWATSFHTATSLLLKQILRSGECVDGTGVANITIAQEPLSSMNPAKAGKKSQKRELASASASPSAEKTDAGMSASSSRKKLKRTEDRQAPVHVPVWHSVLAASISDTAKYPAISKSAHADQMCTWTEALDSVMHWPANPSAPATSPPGKEVSSNETPFRMNKQPGTAHQQALWQLTAVLALVRQVVCCTLPHQSSIPLAGLLLQASQTLMAAADFTDVWQTSDSNYSFQFQAHASGPNTASIPNRQADISEAACKSLSALAALLACNTDAARVVAGLGRKISSMLVAWICSVGPMASKAVGTAAGDPAAADHSSSIQAAQAVANIAEAIMEVWLKDQDGDSAATVDLLLKAVVSHLQQVRSPHDQKFFGHLCSNAIPRCSRLFGQSGARLGSSFSMHVAHLSSAPHLYNFKIAPAWLLLSVRSQCKFVHRSGQLSMFQHDDPWQMSGCRMGCKMHFNFRSGPYWHMQSARAFTEPMSLVKLGCQSLIRHLSMPSLQVSS